MCFHAHEMPSGRYLVHTLILALNLALSGCGARPTAPGVDGGPAPSDAGGTSSFLQEFATRVTSAAAPFDGGPQDCALAIPGRTAADSTEVRAQTASLFLRIINSGIAHPDVTPCGVPGFAGCATRFQNQIFHGNGYLGTSLKPLASEVEAKAANVEVIVWTAEDDAGFSSGPGISIAGTFEGKTMGILFVAGRTLCSP